jgi:hypothetical protein
MFGEDIFRGKHCGEGVGKPGVRKSGETASGVDSPELEVESLEVGKFKRSSLYKAATNNLAVLGGPFCFWFGSCWFFFCLIPFCCDQQLPHIYSQEPCYFK